MAAQIIDLPRSDDDTFPVISGIPLADADPAVIARRLGDKPWEERVWFFNNIVAESLERMIKKSDPAMTGAPRLSATGGGAESRRPFGSRISPDKNWLTVAMGPTSDRRGAHVEA